MVDAAAAAARLAHAAAGRVGAAGDADVADAALARPAMVVGHAVDARARGRVAAAARGGAAVRDAAVGGPAAGLVAATAAHAGVRTRVAVLARGAAVIRRRAAHAAPAHAIADVLPELVVAALGVGDARRRDVARVGDDAAVAGAVTGHHAVGAAVHGRRVAEDIRRIERGLGGDVPRGVGAVVDGAPHH